MIKKAKRRKHYRHMARFSRLFRWPFRDDDSTSVVHGNTLPHSLVDDGQSSVDGVEVLSGEDGVDRISLQAMVQLLGEAYVRLQQFLQPLPRGLTNSVRSGCNN